MSQINMLNYQNNIMKILKKDNKNNHPHNLKQHRVNANENN